MFVVIVHNKIDSTLFLLNIIDSSYTLKANLTFANNFSTHIKVF